MNYGDEVATLIRETQRNSETLGKIIGTVSSFGQFVHANWGLTEDEKAKLVQSHDLLTSVMWSVDKRIRK